MNSKTLSELYLWISAAFCTVVVVSNIISAKMVPLRYFGFSIPAGLVIYPLTFFLSDLVTEVFGTKQAKSLVYTAFGMSLLSFGIIKLAILLPSEIDAQIPFQAVLGLSGWRIFSSLTAYLVSQIADIQLYALIKRWTGPRWLWLRNNGSTCFSQMLDTIVVDLIFLYWGLNMNMAEIWPIMLFSYAYKATFGIFCTPLFYFCIFLIRNKWNENHPGLAEAI